MTEAIARFSLKKKQETIELEAEDGTVIPCILRDMDGEARDDWMEVNAKNMDFDEKGEPKGLKSFKGIQAGFISRCLFSADGKNFSVVDIQKWPSSIREAIFERAQALTGFGKKGKETSKKG